jgi:hypothetical protein
LLIWPYTAMSDWAGKRQQSSTITTENWLFTVQIIFTIRNVVYYFDNQVNHNVHAYITANSSTPKVAIGTQCFYDTGKRDDYNEIGH